MLLLLAPIYLGYFRCPRAFALERFCAQIGDKASISPATVQKPLVPRGPDSSVPAASARLMRCAAFKLAKGYRIEANAAAEPLVEDPVVAQFDTQGRLWVVEMRGYMPNMDGQGEDQPVCRVSILTDTNGDGVMDTRKTFLDHLILPRALMLVRDGALIGAPPHLWFCRDTNGDDVCDEQIEVASDFGVQTDPKKLRCWPIPNALSNSLLWARDNWICAARTTQPSSAFTTANLSGPEPFSAVNTD